MNPMTTPDKLLRAAMATETAGWTDAQKAALLHRLNREATRLTVREQHPTAGTLAQSIDTSTVQTPALQVIDQAIEWALSTRDARVAISVPPQEGKTTRVGVWGVLRALVQNPDRRVVIASYSDYLARSTARTARNIVRESGTGAADPLTGAPLPDKLGLALAGDKSAAGNWKLAGHRGGVYATGVGGSLTGQPADCIVGSTVLHCEHGPITAAEAYTTPPRYLLGYNERTGQPAWHRLEAARRIERRPVVEVTTRGGKSLTCTADHRVYTGGRYTPAGSLRPGETVLHIDTSAGVPDMHGTIHREAGRGTKDRYPRRPHALLESLRLGECGAAVSGEVLPLRQAGPPESPVNVLRRMFTGEVPAEKPTRRLPGVRAGVQGDLLPNRVLFPDVRGPGALETDDRGRELPSSASLLPGLSLPADQTLDHREGRVQVRDLRDPDGPNRSSLRRGPGEQPGGEPDNPLRLLPHNAPQIGGDSVSVVADAGEATVYDFQVDGDNNFFANGLLVHNCLIIDDPLKGMTEADSDIEREKVITWWESVAQTRLAPGAPVIIIQTRWHEKDLVGHVVAQDKHRDTPMWKVINLPAVATPGVPDALNRPPGTAMESARGRTPEDFDRIRADVGERVWSALYLGAPTPAQGGLFSQEHFDRHRAPTTPDAAAARLVSVDPAETGKGDEAGIIALTVTADGRAWVTDDWSGRMQSDEWARKAVLLALTTTAGELTFEAFTSGPTYERVILGAWRRIRDEARLLRQHNGDVAAAAHTYTTREDTPADPLTALRDIDGIPVPDQTDPPFRIHPWRAKGDKVARAAGTRQATATGRLRMVGTHTTLETQATTWQTGQDSPDRMDALVNGFERGMQLIGGQSEIATPGQVQTSTGGMGTNFWSTPIG